MTYNCAICGQPVDPAVDILLTIGKKPLVPVHVGECADTARGVVVLGRQVLERRWPWLSAARTMIARIMEK